jgi:hypothetical protein
MTRNSRWLCIAISSLLTASTLHAASLQFVPRTIQLAREDVRETAAGPSLDDTIAYIKSHLRNLNSNCAGSRGMSDRMLFINLDRYGNVKYSSDEPFEDSKILLEWGRWEVAGHNKVTYNFNIRDMERPWSGANGGGSLMLDCANDQRCVNKTKIRISGRNVGRSWTSTETDASLVCPVPRLTENVTNAFKRYYDLVGGKRTSADPFAPENMPRN